MTSTTTAIPAARIGDTVRSGTLHEVTNPADGTVASTAGWVGTDAVDQAVDAAVAVRRAWADTPARERAAAMRSIAADLRSDVDRLAGLIVSETGKRRAEAQAEVEFSAKYFDWFGEAATTVDTTSGLTTPIRRFTVRRVPAGVVAALGTWNFPLSIPARKIAASLAAGCPTILKASERTPATADALVVIGQRHLPTGVLGSVLGDAAISNALIDHPQVAAVSFTGSTAIGRQVAERCAVGFTRAVLELGGRAPFIVRHDADLADAVEQVMIAKLRNNGESCIAANNVFVHAGIATEFTELLAERVRAVTTGSPDDPDTDLGPLIDAAAVDRLEGLIDDAAAAGAEVTRGRPGPENGCYLSPALVECTGADGIALWEEEVFGPVISLRTFTDESAVTDEVNGWGVGLAGYVCGTDAEANQALAESLRVGIVGINNAAPNTPEVPFGGFGGSGLSREGGLSGYLAFTEEQTISTAR
jgi:succinate-semialdehyde dehydrogenase/glutarate-semialdehyde dehydrogenase